MLVGSTGSRACAEARRSRRDLSKGAQSSAGVQERVCAGTARGAVRDLNKAVVKTNPLYLSCLTGSRAECAFRGYSSDFVLISHCSNSHLRAGSPHARSTVVTAVKFTIADQPQPIDALLKGCIGRGRGGRVGSSPGVPHLCDPHPIPVAFTVFLCFRH